MDFKFVNRNSLISLRDPRIMMCGERKPGRNIQLYIDEARKTLQSRGLTEALHHFDAMVKAYLKIDDPNSTKIFIAEADALFRSVKEKDPFNDLLRRGAHHFTAGETAEALALFDQVMRDAESETDQGKKDNIFRAAAATFWELNEVSEAIRVANRIKDKAVKLTFFIGMADSLAEQGSMAASKAILLNHCGPIARSHSDDNGSGKDTKIEQLLIVAEKLVKLGDNHDASSIIAELVEILPKSWLSMRQIEIEKREEVAVLLVKIGQRSEAIDLMTAGVLPDEYLKTLSPEEVHAAKMRIIDNHSKKLSRALKSC